MRNSLPPTQDEVELTTSSPQETQIQEHKSIPIEQIKDSNSGRQIIAVAQRESLQQPRQQTLDVVERLTHDQMDEKPMPTAELIKSQEELNSSLSVRELSPSTGGDESMNRSVRSVDLEMPSLIEEKADALQTFLSNLGITPKDLERLDIPEEPLRQLFQQETACYSLFKWNRFEQIIDNALYGLLLSRSDLQLENKKICLSPRVRPHEHSILLRRRSSLRKAYAADKLVDGIRLGVFGFVRGFITIMLLYRLGSWASSGQRDFSAFEAIFNSNNQKGIDSLTGLLAKLNPSILRFILTTPLILGAIQSLLEFATARQDSQEKVIQRINVLATYLLRNPGWRSDFIRESIPVLSRLISVGKQIELLTQSLNWNGQLTLESRQNAFAMIRQIAQRGRKVSQWTAMDSLARLVQGIGFRDFPRLQAAGYDKAVLVQLLFIKAHALADLGLLSRKGSEENILKTLPRRLYASYLLWWLGQSTSWWRQRLPFFSLKAGILILEIYFFYNIANSLVKAIHCPDKPGFQLGDGYLPWASDYSSRCFARRILSFIQFDYIETTQQLVAEIPRYHLTDFVNLNLSVKFITLQDTQSIIQAVLAQGAPLQSLDLGGNPLNELPLGFFADLSQLQFLSLHSTQLTSLAPGLFDGLTQLQIIDLSDNSISNLSVGTLKGLNQLQALYLGGNILNSLPPAIFADLGQLQLLDLSSLQMDNLSPSFFTGLSQLQSLFLYGNPLHSLQAGVFAGLSQLQYLDLSTTQLGDLPAGAFNGIGQLRSLSLAGNFLTELPAGLFTSLGQLQSLDLCGNLFNTSAMLTILTALPATLVSLNISNNAIESLPNNTMGLWPPALRTLAVGGNRFVPATLSSAWMDHFPFQLTDFSLGASRSIVNLSTGAFAAFRQLQYLNLSYNLLASWSPNMLSGLSQLQALDLSGNLFTAFPPAAFADLPQLQSLTLTNNLISNLPANIFSELNQLQQLDLSGNLLGLLPAGLFSDLSQLQFLDLSFNNLVSLPAGSFSQLNQLQLLNLSSNLISNLPSGIFTSLRQLKIIDLSFMDYSNTDFLANISIGFPYQITQFIISVSSRNGTFYGLDSTNWFTTISPCLTQLNSIDFKGDIAGFIAKVGIGYVINLESVVLQQLLKNVCESQLCYANLPPQQLCHPITTSSSQTVTPATYLDRSLIFTENSYGKTTWQSTQLALPHFKSGSVDFYFPNSSLTPVLSSDIAALGDQSADDYFTDSLSTATAVSAAIIGVAVFGIFLYKNSPWIKTIVDNGCHFLQRCCERAMPTSTTQRQFSPASTSPRYSVFTSLSSSVKKVFTPAVSSGVIQGKSISNHSSS
jgi:Leucine-rich repeat (LRR) protein